MRLIDADALIELFREVIGGIARKQELNGNLEHMVRASAMVIEMIKDAPSIESEHNWIPCSERLPDRDVALVSTRWGEVTDGEFWDREHGLWFICGGERNATTEQIKAWKPLPEPYREVEHER